MLIVGCEAIATSEDEMGRRFELSVTRQWPGDGLSPPTVSVVTNK